MKNMKLILSVLVIFGGLFAVVTYLQNSNQVVKLAGTEIPAPYEIGDFHLTSSHGSFERSQLLGKYTVLYFGFTMCADACPITLAQFKQEIAKLDNNAQAKVQFLMVSVDPERDTAERLQTYVAGFDPRILSAVGPEPELQRLVSYVKTTFSKEDVNVGDPNLYKMAHSPRYFLIDPQAKLIAVYNPPLEAGVLAKDLNALTVRDVKSRWVF